MQLACKCLCDCAVMSMSPPRRSVEPLGQTMVIWLASNIDIPSDNFQVAADFWSVSDLVRRRDFKHTGTRQCKQMSKFTILATKLNFMDFKRFRSGIGPLVISHGTECNGTSLFDIWIHFDEVWCRGFRRIRASPSTTFHPP